jgi:hypothetical protein
MTSCNSTKYVPARFDDNIHVVNIENLIANIGKYHGKTVQTRGLFIYGFETSVIFPALAVSEAGIFSFRIKSMPGVWLEPDFRFIPMDSVENYEFKKSGRLTTVQGIVDTTQPGHLGEYVGTITQARFVSSE